MTIWYILGSFGTFLQVLVSCNKKTLATVDEIVDKVFFRKQIGSLTLRMTKLLWTDLF
jgi:hypothetical protein